MQAIWMMIRFVTSVGKRNDTDQTTRRRGTCDLFKKSAGCRRVPWRFLTNTCLTNVAYHIVVSVPMQPDAHYHCKTVTSRLPATTVASMFHSRKLLQRLFSISEWREIVSHYCNMPPTLSQLSATRFTFRMHKSRRRAPSTFYKRFSVSDRENERRRIMKANEKTE